MVLQRGGSMDKLEALQHIADSDLLSERERAALSYAQQLTLNCQEGIATTRERLRDYFSDDAIIELTALVAFQNMSSKFNTALDVPAQGFCSALHAQVPHEGGTEREY